MLHITVSPRLNRVRLGGEFPKRTPCSSSFRNGAIGSCLLLFPVPARIPRHLQIAASCKSSLRSIPRVLTPQTKVRKHNIQIEFGLHISRCHYHYIFFPRPHHPPPWLNRVLDINTPAL
ncbi:unnamed protein product [Periconia digitata]|uniref:Uncharacterized protein n=1 Tax=Periconia digitata TaxID=1303443 RepID=A0A9W4XGC8_9PLEO|nr:unnamed protein product [Periconia digitata]